MEDSANAFIDRAVQLATKHDSAKTLAQFPTSGPIMYVEDGLVLTDRDMIAHGASQEVSEMTLRPDWTVNSRRIDVLAPDAAAFTISVTAAITNPKTNEPFALNGAFTAVLARRDGAMRLLQGHRSWQRQ
jgi:hypothetical protein